MQQWQCICQQGLTEAAVIPESPLAREAVSEPLRDPSDIWRLGRRGVVWAGVAVPAFREAAVSWRVRGPGALRRLRVLLRRDLRRRVEGGCITHANTHSRRCNQHRYTRQHSSNMSNAVKQEGEHHVLRICAVEPQLWPKPQVLQCVTPSRLLMAGSAVQVHFGLSCSNMHVKISARMGQHLKSETQEQAHKPCDNTSTAFFTDQAEHTGLISGWARMALPFSLALAAAAASSNTYGSSSRSATEEPVLDALGELGTTASAAERGDAAG